MKMEELRGKSRDELLDELVNLRREQFNLRMQRAMGELSQHHQFRDVRRTIARINTLLNEKAEAGTDA